MHKSAPIVLFTGVQRLARELRTMGYASACLREPCETATSPEGVDFWIPYDPSDLEGLETWAGRWPERHRVAAVINRRERRVMEHAVLNRALKRPGVDLEQARTLRDKLLFRKALEAKAPHLNPPFQSAQLFSPQPPTIKPPFILKPTNLFKSQLITLCHRVEEWKEIRHDLIDRLRDTGLRHGVQAGANFLAEPYIRGKEFSLDVFVTREGRVISTPAVELTPARDWDMEDFHVAVRRLPADISTDEREVILGAVREGIEALGLRATPVHADLTLLNEGPVILEMAPRIGGYRSEMMHLAHGSPLDPLNLDLAVGRDFDWRARWHRSVAVVELFPPRSGRLVGFQGLQDVETLPSFKRLRQRTPAGETVGFAREGYRCPIFVVLCHQDTERVRRDARSLRELVTIEVED